MNNFYQINIDDFNSHNIDVIYEEIFYYATQTDHVVIINIKNLTKLNVKLIELLCYLKSKFAILGLKYFIISNKTMKRYLENVNLVCHTSLNTINGLINS